MAADAALRRPFEAPSRAANTVAWLTARRAARSGAGWGLVFAVYVIVSAKGYASAYPDEASRRQLAESLGTNSGLAALLGPARQLDTVAGFTAWRCTGVLSIVGAVWGLLAGTRLLRGDEDAGRWELLLTGLTTRGRAAAQAVVGLAFGWLALWGVTAVLTVAIGRTVDPPFAVSGALLLSVTLTASAAMFLAAGALCSQLASTRRQAAGVAGAAFGVSFLIRMVADSSPRLEWLRWASPLGWAEEIHPLTGSNALPLLPIALTTAVLAVIAVRLAGARDLGASVLPSRDTAPPRTRLLTGPLGLAARLVRPAALGWIAAFAAGGLVFGLVAQSAASAASGSSTAADILHNLGAPQLSVAAYLGVTFLIVSALVGTVAASQAVAAREEEADGRLDNLLARPVSRVGWLAGRLAIGSVLLVLCGLAAGVTAWLGNELQNSGLAFWSVLEGGINTVAPGLFVLGAGALALAVVPRLVAPVTYGIVAWSFLVELVGSSLNLSAWILDTSLIHHLTPAPAVDPDWASAGVMAGLGIVMAALGAIAFQRRDLVSA